MINACPLTLETTCDTDYQFSWLLTLTELTPVTEIDRVGILQYKPHMHVTDLLLPCCLLFWCRNMNFSQDPFLNKGLDDSFGFRIMAPTYDAQPTTTALTFGKYTPTWDVTTCDATTISSSSGYGNYVFTNTFRVYFQTVRATAYLYTGPAATLFMDKFIYKFSRYIHEDGQNFFVSLSITWLFLVLTPRVMKQTIALFIYIWKDLPLHGFTLFLQKTTGNLSKMNSPKVYGNNINDPRLIPGPAAFDNLMLLSGQTTEEFHSIVLEKGTCPGKTDQDMTNKFINSLPSQLAFFICTGWINTFPEALHSAKIGEAHGYWIHVPLSISASFQLW